MKFIALKNQNKKEDKHPDFKMYVKDSEGDVIEEWYKTKDGETKKRWMDIGAIWFKVENGKIKSASIITDDEKFEGIIKFKNRPDDTIKENKTDDDTDDFDKFGEVPF